jgi:3-oxoadipate enol-lactonase
MYAPLPDGGRLAYDIAGEGPALLLMRPLGGSRVSWDGFATLLAMRARVVSFDPRGVGDSSAAPLWCSTRGMARDALCLLDHLQLNEAHVYGISLGGMVASWLAVDAAERVGKLVLASTLPRGLEAHAPGGTLGLWSMLRCLAKPAGEAEACLATHILSPQFRRERPEAVRRVQQLARQKPASHRAFLALAKAAASHDVRARLSSIRAETLVLIGEYDPLLTVESQRELLAGLPRAEYELIAGAGHDLSVEAPEPTARRVLAHVLGIHQ